VQREIETILGTGVELRTNTPVGPASGFSFERLRNEYDGVFLAVGAQLSKKIRLEGSATPGVLWGFLHEV
jgi:NADPH-dependent glutamate synthase beta subunit-like oxidoreductase